MSKVIFSMCVNQVKIEEEVQLSEFVTDIDTLQDAWEEWVLKQVKGSANVTIEYGE